MSAVRHDTTIFADQELTVNNTSSTVYLNKTKLTVESNWSSVSLHCDLPFIAIIVVLNSIWYTLMDLNHEMLTSSMEIEFLSPQLLDRSVLGGPIFGSLRDPTTVYILCYIIVRRSFVNTISSFRGKKTMQLLRMTTQMCFNSHLMKTLKE